MDREAVLPNVKDLRSTAWRHIMAQISKWHKTEVGKLEYLSTFDCHR